MTWDFWLAATVPDSGRAALHLSAVVASIGITVSLLEDLTVYAQYRNDGLLSWSVARLRGPWTSTGRLAGILDLLLGAEGYRAVLALGLAAAALMPVTLWIPALLVPLAAVILAVLTLGNVRTLYGADGTDQLHMILFASILLGQLLPEGSIAQRACVWFLALQVGLAYFIAGVAKLASPVWRSGQALVGIMSTRSYGHEWLHGVLRRYPVLSLAGCWSVMVFEVAFPLVFVLDAPYAAALLVVGAGFHAGCAVFMGLNNFLFAFVSTYPVVWAVCHGVT